MPSYIHMRKRRNGEIHAYDVRGVLDGKQFMPKGWSRNSVEVADMMEFRDHIDWLENNAGMFYAEQVFKVPEKCINAALCGDPVSERPR